MTPTRKPCARCGKPLSKKRAAERRKYCFADAAVVRREQKEAAYERRVESLYGLRPGEYRKLYESQGGRCYICQKRSASRRLDLDHDHKLGLHNRKAVRGLLHNRENRLLGHAGDDPGYFDRAAEYLRNPPAWKVLNND